MYDESNITCRELPYVSAMNGTCRYELVIPTKLACLRSSHEDALSSALRATVWVTVIAAVIFVVYCLVGYGMNATRYGRWCDCMANVPNANFWCCCCYRPPSYVNIREPKGLINAQADYDQFE